ncbi:MAG: hypothetical protein K2X82_27115 [Gemmataceae bacterium]|nr:hypothetical protein [Gemmataceae bacterium]
MNWRSVWSAPAVAGMTEAHLELRRLGVADTGVAAAVAELDRQFLRNPAEVGESRAGNERVAFEGPLVVHFEVHEDERVVVVNSAWWRGRV